MLSIMINGSYGGFHFSDAAIDEYNRRKAPEAPVMSKGHYCDADRADPLMVQIVRGLGSKALGTCADIQLQQIPAKFARHFAIKEYNGLK